MPNIAYANAYSQSGLQVPPVLRAPPALRKEGKDGTSMNAWTESTCCTVCMCGIAPDALCTCHDPQQIGDTIGTTRDGGDTPILLFSIVGGAWPTTMF